MPEINILYLISYILYNVSTIYCHVESLLNLDLLTFSNTIILTITLYLLYEL